MEMVTDAVVPMTMRAQRVPVPRDPLRNGAHFDYGDAFEVRLAAGDLRSSLDFARAALEEAHPMVRELIWRVHRHLLRFDQGSRTSANHVLGWEVLTADHGRAVMAAESPLLRAVIVGHRVDPSAVTVATLLYFRRPVLARTLWTAIGPLHRRITPYLLEHAARAGQPQSS